jgi:hypothetical protein
MTDERKQRQMQEALDATLSPDAYRDLMQDMQQDTEAATDYQKLQSVDGMLKEARTQPRPAPNLLAQRIMAKVAKPESLPVAQPLKSGRALAISLATLAIVGFPILVGISLAILSVFGTGSALSGFALTIVGAAVALYAGWEALVTNAVNLVILYPIVFALLLLIPLAGFGLRRMGSFWREDTANES